MDDDCDGYVYSDSNGDDHDDDDDDDGSSDSRKQQQPQKQNDIARSTDLRHDGNKRWPWLTFQRHSIENFNWIINTFIVNTNCSTYLNYEAGCYIHPHNIATTKNC